MPCHVAAGIAATWPIECVALRDSEIETFR